MKLLGFLLLAAAISAVKTAENTCLLNTSEKGIIQFTDYPVAPGAECLTYTAKVTVEGYNVDVVFEFLELDDENKDYLIISPGSSLMKDETSIVLTGTMKTKRKLRVINHSEMFVTLVTQKRENNTDTLYKGFRFSYSAFGELTTQLPTTSPRPILPSAPSDVDEDATVYVQGMPPKDFTAKVGAFKEIVANMTETYCAGANIEFLTPPTSQNIVIHQITSCAITWPQWETCIQINLKIAVYVPENHRYELTRANILEMWNKYANEELQALNLQVYTAPDNDSALQLWLYITGGVALVFTITLVLAWQLNLFSKNKKAAMGSYFNPPERVSSASTDSWISSYQSVPPIFEYVPSPSQDLSSVITPSDTLTIPQVQNARPSEEFRGGLLFRGHDNPSFDISSEESSQMQKRLDDYSSDDDETRTTDKKQNQDHLYEEPKQHASEDDDDDDDYKNNQSTL